MRRRRLWLGVGAIALLAAGYGAFRLYFVSTNEALRHAEDFLFRRMTAAQLTEPGQYRFFYITNRRQGAVDGELEARFTDERTGDLTFGAFDAAIQPSLGLGYVIYFFKFLF